MNPKGIHIIADCWGVERKRLNPRYLRRLAINAVEIGNFTYINDVYHEFEGGGFSIAVLLAESHVSIHTYPERSYAALDIYGCGIRGDVEVAYNYLINELKPTKVFKLEVERGNRHYPSFRTSVGYCRMRKRL